MPCFEMVKYHTQQYPEDIPLRIVESAAHFDTESLTGELKLSLHTEYSYGKRKFDSELLQRFPEILAAQKDGVPQLWKSRRWAAEFAEFLFAIAGEDVPEVIEIHPPFTDYATLQSFAECYRVFEDVITERFPGVSILIENRCGSVYKGGRFLISKVQDIERLCGLIAENDFLLKIACDIPQIYTAHTIKKPEQYTDLLRAVSNCREWVGGVHLWGKRKSESGRLVSHCGDLNSYFDGNIALKNEFLQAFRACFDDDTVRKMVLEVNSGNDDLRSIIEDLWDIGTVFV